MFNEPNTPDSPQHEGAHTLTLARTPTHTGTDVYIHVHTHAHAHTTGPAGLYLLVSDIESPAAANYSGKHGESIAADRQKKKQTNLNQPHRFAIEDTFY